MKIWLASFAALLLVGMLALGSMVAVNANNAGGISAILTAAPLGQKPAAQDAIALKGTNQTTTDSSQQAAPSQQAQGGVADARTAVKAAGPAVVTVINKLQQQQGTTRGRGGLGQVPSAEASGSGVIIDSQGHIITNQHVVEGQQSLTVVFSDGTEVPATLVGEDAYSDIAVIKVDAKVPAYAQLGDSDKVEVGQPVVAIGTALGNYTNTVTEGIISGVHRQLGDGGTSTQDLIQTDAAINHGNSGGPLLDLNGVVLGINTAVVRSSGMAGDVAEGLGFAIPVNTAKNVANQLMSTGTISHPYIGITYQVITPQLATDQSLPVQQGVYVSDVTAGSPAEKAGILPNSIITKIDGTDVGTDNGPTLSELVSKHKVGDSIKLTVIAPVNGGTSTVTVVLGERPAGQ